MFFEIRNIGKFLRGSTTPFQLLASTVLAGIIAFLPGFRQAPGLMLAAILLLLILNTNLLIAGAVGFVGKLLGLVLQPVSFALGRFLIDGPAEPLLTRLINGPVTAWFGFENYVATGGLLLGTLFGLIAGVFISRSLNRFRRRMAELNQDETYRQAAGNPVSRAIGWLLFGGLEGKEDWDKLAQRRMGKPVRWTGIIIAALVVGLIVASPHLVNEVWLGKLAARQVEPHNGASVDIAKVDLDVAGARLAVDTLALCNPNQLDQNTFEALRLEAGLSGSDLLSKKYAISKLEISGARLGENRDHPGRRIGRPPKPAPDPETEAGAEGEDREVSIEGVMKKSEEVKARLAEIKKWIDKISGAMPEGEEAPGGETLEERLKRQARELGYGKVIASHRVADKPRFTIRELVMREVTARQLVGEVLHIYGKDLSTQPHLLEGSSTIRVTSDSDNVGLTLTLDRDTGPIAFHYNQLPVETVKGWLKQESRFPFEGGHFRVRVDGTISAGEVHLPIQVTPVGSQVRLGGQLRRSPEVPFTVLVSGPLDNPRIKPQLSGMLSGIKGAVIQEGKDRIGGKIGDLIGGDKEGGEAGEAAKGVLDGLFKKRRKNQSE